MPADTSGLAIIGVRTRLVRNCTLSRERDA
jgi:hypothetical protein